MKYIWLLKYNVGSNGNVIIHSHWQISFQSTGDMIINWQYHFKILTNGRNTSDVYQNSRKHYIHHFHCAYTFVWPYLILKAFSIYNAVFFIIFLFLVDILSLSFNIFGLFQKYVLIYCFLKSTKSVHSNKNETLLQVCHNIYIFFQWWCPIRSSPPSNFNF